jgi:hypothetical protein
MEILPAPQTKGIHLFIAPRAFLKQSIPGLIAQMAVTTPLKILDGSNTINVHQLARQIRLRTGELFQALDRVHLSRAFTCYQMATMLCEAAACAYPIVILELLATFYDESVSIIERTRLLNQSLLEIEQMSRSSPVLITASDTTLPENEAWLNLLEKSAGQIWRFEKQKIPATPRMF